MIDESNVSGKDKVRVVCLDDLTAALKELDAGVSFLHEALEQITEAHLETAEAAFNLRNRLNDLGKPYDRHKHGVV